MFTSHLGKRLERSEGLSDHYHYLYRRWLAEWYKQDFSWEGLARIPLTVRDPFGTLYDVSLQDYWRAEENQLIPAADGRQYTRFHLPFEIQVGADLAPTEKQEWSPEKWNEIYSDLKKRIVDHTVIIKLGKISREINPFLAARTYNQTDYFDDLSTSEQNFSGLHLALNVPEFTQYPTYKLDWTHFQRFELSETRPAPSDWDIILKNCLISEHMTIGSVATTKTFKLDHCVALGPITFNACQFGTVSIDRSRIAWFDFEDTRLEYLKIRGFIPEPEKCSFHHMTVKKETDLRGSGLSFVGAFYNAKIEGRLLIDHETDGRPADKVFQQDVIDDALTQTSRPLFTKVPTLDRGVLREERSQLFRQIEGGALVLKTKMKEENFEELAHRFYRYELWARNYNPSTDNGTRLLLTFYRWSSQYGYNVTRPLLWTLYLSFALSFLYLFCFTIGAGWTVDLLHPNLTALAHFDEAWSFSLGRIAPIIPWSVGIPVPQGSFEYALKTADGVTGLVIHFVGIVQTIASTCLFFLAALAARRRFKMSD